MCDVNCMFPDSHVCMSRTTLKRNKRKQKKTALLNNYRFA